MFYFVLGHGVAVGATATDQDLQIYYAVTFRRYFYWTPGVNYQQFNVTVSGRISGSAGDNASAYSVCSADDRELSWGGGGAGLSYGPLENDIDTYVPGFWVFGAGYVYVTSTPQSWSPVAANNASSATATTSISDPF
jgi:hypothetical protein